MDPPHPQFCPFSSWKGPRGLVFAFVSNRKSVAKTFWSESWHLKICWCPVESFCLIIFTTSSADRSFTVCVPPPLFCATVKKYSQVPNISGCPLPGGVFSSSWTLDAAIYTQSPTDANKQDFAVSPFILRRQTRLLPTVFLWLQRIPVRDAERSDHRWPFVKWREKNKLGEGVWHPCNIPGEDERRAERTAVLQVPSACIALDLAAYTQAVRLLITVCIGLPVCCMLQQKHLCIRKKLLCLKTCAVFSRSIIINLY